jgi:hypothetical protein
MEKFKPQACRACGKMGHKIRECKAKDDMFAAGDFFYFPRKWREEVAKQSASH